MTRQDFCKPYLVALYLLNRRTPNIDASISQIISQFLVPRDKYFEGEAVGYMRHNGWIVTDRSGSDVDFLMSITEQGKIHSEMFIEQGVSVQAVDDLFVSDGGAAAGATIVSVPASDRVVTLSDNETAADTVKASLAELSEHLKSGNDVGNLTDVEVEEAIREIYLLEQEFSRERVRVDWVAPIAKSCLKWIADKAAGAALGKLALKALHDLAAFLGFVI